MLGIAPHPQVPKERVIATIKHIHSHYKNMNFHIFKSEHSTKVVEELGFVKEVPWVPKPQWHPFDMVVVIGTESKQLYSGNGQQLTREFARELLR